jgi:hypothetical protein
MTGKKLHGHTRPATPTYRSWAGMIQRCTNPKASGYHKYGGRGIRVCDRWKIFKNFLDDMGERPIGKTIDRIDNNGNYEPSNCKWSTPYEQTHNQRPRKNAVPERWCQICSISFKPQSNKSPGKFCSRECMSESMLDHNRNGISDGWRARERRTARGLPEEARDMAFFR